MTLQRYDFADPKCVGIHHESDSGTTDVFAVKSFQKVEQGRYVLYADAMAHCAAEVERVVGKLIGAGLANTLEAVKCLDAKDAEIAQLLACLRVAVDFESVSPELAYFRGQIKPVPWITQAQALLNQ